MNENNLWKILLLIAVSLLCLMTVRLHAEPIQITHNGVDGYFLTKQDFTDVLLVLSDLKYYRELSTAYKLEIKRLKQTNIITGGIGLVLLGVTIWQGVNK